jgi:hypothetical protein
MEIIKLATIYALIFKRYVIIIPKFWKGFRGFHIRKYKGRI